MPRVKRGVTFAPSTRRSCSVPRALRRATQAHQDGARSVLHAGMYAYRDRRNRKRDMRSLWITRINAASRLYGLHYRDFIHGLALAGVEVDRKVMADLAVHDLRAFGALVEAAKAALPAKVLARGSSSWPPGEGPGVSQPLCADCTDDAL